MSFARKIKRIKNIDKIKKEQGRTTCPRCHDKLVEKHGYGIVCPNCGWHKTNVDHPTEKGGVE